MLDQSFSANNFLSIAIDENRKGVNLEKEFYKSEIYDKYTLVLKEINKSLRERKKTVTDEELFKRYFRFLNHFKRKVKKEKENKFLEILNVVCEKVNKKGFILDIDKSPLDPLIFTTPRNPENYFTLKQLQYNFRKLYSVKQSNRYEIVNQVKCLLDDKFPKFIIRTDIKGFFENIPTEKLIKKINTDHLLSPLSKKFIRQIIWQYKTKSNKSMGIPRGIGISAYLSELYMRNVDDEIKKMENLVYYARYVDDIIAVFIPSTITKNFDTSKYLKKIETIIKEKGLELNKKKEKTKEFDLLKSEDEEHQLNYLGYKYIFENKIKRNRISKIDISLTDLKIKRYKSKIKRAFEIYQIQEHINKTRGYRILKKRIKYLTCNTRLTGNKHRILIGIYFSNNLINNYDCLDQLDRSLNYYINRYIDLPNKKEILKKYSFKRGFLARKFVYFTSHQIKEILQIWKG